MPLAAARRLASPSGFSSASGPKVPSIAARHESHVASSTKPSLSAADSWADTSVSVAERTSNCSRQLSRPWASLHHPDEVELPRNPHKDLDARPWWHKASLEGKPQLADPVMLKFRAEGSRVPDQSDAQLAEMTANYYGMISQVDHNVGRIMSALEAAGVADNTLVIYTTDHGELLGNHGLYLKGPTPYEDLLRVSMVARGPGVASRQLVVEPVSTLDLAATF